VSAPVLILSRAAVWMTGCAAGAGGDDYLTKPFALAELLARLRTCSSATALRGRGDPVPGPGPGAGFAEARSYAVGRGAATDAAGVCVAGISVPQRGPVVTRSMILDQVWGMRIQPDTNVVDVHIYRLRARWMARDSSR